VVGFRGRARLATDSMEKSSYPFSSNRPAAASRMACSLAALRTAPIDVRDGSFFFLGMGTIQSNQMTVRLRGVAFVINLSKRFDNIFPLKLTTVIASYPHWRRPASGAVGTQHPIPVGYAHELSSRWPQLAKLFPGRGASGRERLLHETAPLCSGARRPHNADRHRQVAGGPAPPQKN